MRLFLHSRLLNPQTNGSKATENLLPMVGRKKKRSLVYLQLYAGTLHTIIWLGPADWNWWVTHSDAEDGDVSKLAEVPAAKRKTVKRPQPKLDSSRYDWWRRLTHWKILLVWHVVDAVLDVLLRLTSDRGLPALRTLFDNVRFKGKGHEVKAADVCRDDVSDASRVSYFILTPSVFCWSRRRTFDCSCRRWRTGPTGSTPKCSLKSLLTAWRDSARRRKSRWEPGDV